MMTSSMKWNLWASPSQNNAKHLQAILRKCCKVSTDWSSQKHVGLTVDWDYSNKLVHHSMPGYIKATLTRFQHLPLSKTIRSTVSHTPPNFGSKNQYPMLADTACPVNQHDKKFIEKVTGTSLYYAFAINNTMLTALSAIVANQEAPTQQT